MIAASHPGPGDGKILVVSADGDLRHRLRVDLATLFAPGDLIIANDAATLPASLVGTHVSTGAAIEVRLAGWGSSPALPAQESDVSSLNTSRSSPHGGEVGRATCPPKPEGRRRKRRPGEGASAALTPSPDACLSACVDLSPMGRGRWPISLDPTRFIAVVFGSGDFRTRTEDRPSPPTLAPGDRLVLGPLAAIVERTLGHPRLVALSFQGSAGAVWAGLANHGRPIQYAHVPEPLALWDIWTRIAAHPVAFEAPSAGFALDWRTLAAWRSRGVGFATLTHAAGISSTGDAALDECLPFDEPFRIPPKTAAAIARTRSRGGRIVAIGTTVVRALEAAAEHDGKVHAGDGMATGRIEPDSEIRIVDAILSGVHQPGESHFELLRAFTDDITLDRAAAELESHRYRSHEFGDSVLIERHMKVRARESQSRAFASAHMPTRLSTISSSRTPPCNYLTQHPLPKNNTILINTRFIHRITILE